MRLNRQYIAVENSIYGCPNRQKFPLVSCYLLW